jgi:transketolase
VTPGIEAATGSLGQGLSIGFGMAWAARRVGKDFRVYVLLGDGECQEGQVWEAALAVGHNQLNNLIAIVDYNKYQLDGAIADIMDLEPFAAKWQAMGWQVREIDGHDLEAVLAALRWAQQAGGPACIIANTIKGKGVSFMEGQNAYHGVAPSDDELARALAELAVLEAAEASIDREAEEEAR